MPTTLETLTDPHLIFPGLAAADAAGVLRELADRLARGGVVADPETLFQRLWEREQLGSTAIGRGIAIPHCKLDGLEHVVLAVGLAPAGVDFGAADGQPVRLFFVVVSPSRSPAEHLQSLAAISRWVKTDGRVERLLGLQDPDAILDLLRERA
ncbi:MAG TPA: PTS sugar transporter subunit IIA [Thermoanaerobaculia bacterium]|nr:PTS sugar transporter subunit IIA [Thermoanaerobaculia bacterium]